MAGFFSGIIDKITSVFKSKDLDEIIKDAIQILLTDGRAINHNPEGYMSEEQTLAEQIKAAVDEATSGFAKKNGELLAELKEARKGKQIDPAELDKLQDKIDKSKNNILLENREQRKKSKNNMYDANEKQARLFYLAVAEVKRENTELHGKDITMNNFKDQDPITRYKILNAIDELTEPEKKFFQSSTDSIYNTFKSRVSEGRKRNMEYVDSIAQGRVWTGTRGLTVGLVDEIGTL